MITPSLYLKVKFRVEEFKLRCKHDNIPGLAYIHSYEAIEEKPLDIPRMLNEAIIA